MASYKKQMTVGKMRVTVISDMGVLNIYRGGQHFVDTDNKAHLINSGDKESSLLNSLAPLSPLALALSLERERERERVYLAQREKKMDGFFSKASSFLNSQAEHEAPPASSHANSPHSPEETRKPASSGGYGDLLTGAQALMNSAKSSHDDKSVDSEEKSHKAPSSGGYGDLLASAQSLMGSAKPSGAGESVHKEGESHNSGGYGELLASAQSLMGSAKLSGGGEGTPVDKKEGALKTTSSGDSGYGDMYASAQVLMGAAKASRDGAAADMGEVAGATANLIGAATRYGNLEKGAYGEYAHKAQSYLHDYQASHSKTSPQAIHKPSSTSEGQDEEECNPPSSKAHEIPLKSSVISEEDDPPRRKHAENK